MSKSSSAEKKNDSTDYTQDIATSGDPKETPKDQEIAAVSKDAVKETRILNENITQLYSVIQTLVKGIERSIGESTKIGSNGIVGKSPSRSPYSQQERTNRKLENIAIETEQDVSAKEYKGSFGEVFKEWKGEKKEALQDRIKTAVNPKDWDIRGITGIEKGSGGLIDKVLSNREARQAQDTERKDFVKNAVKFGGVDEAAAKEQYEKILEAQKKTAEITKRINEAKEAGYAPSKEDIAERNQAVKAQIAIDPRTAKYEKNDSTSRVIPPTPAVTPPASVVISPTPVAAQAEASKPEAKEAYKPEIISEEPIAAKVKRESEEASAPTPEPVLGRKESKGDTTDDFIGITPKAVASLAAPLGTEDKALSTSSVELTENQAEAANTITSLGETLKSSLEVQQQTLESLKELVGLQKETLETAKTKEGGGSGNGEGGNSLLDTASDLLGNGKGKLKGLAKKSMPMLKKAGSFLGRNAGKIGAVAGVAAGAYEAYSGWGDANEQVASGEITEDQADEKKGSAVGGGVGGAAGAWGGAAAGAAIGSVVPVVGTAIGGVVGGALGYMAGSGVGSKVGGALVSGYKSIFGTREEEEQLKKQQGLAPTPTLANKQVEPAKEGLFGKLTNWATNDKTSLMDKAGDVVKTITPLGAVSALADTSIGKKAVGSIKESASGLVKWATDDKTSFMEKAADVVKNTTPIGLASNIGSKLLDTPMGGKAVSSLKDTASGLANWATDDKTSLMDKAGDVLKYASPMGLMSSVAKGGVDWLMGGESKTAPDPKTDVSQIGRTLDKESSDVAIAKESKSIRDSVSSIVNAPTTINNNTNNILPPMPIRNPESSHSRYIGTRFAV